MIFMNINTTTVKNKAKTPPNTIPLAFPNFSLGKGKIG
jgi:hypothetical protein